MAERAGTHLATISAVQEPGAGEEGAHLRAGHPHLSGAADSRCRGEGEGARTRQHLHHMHEGGYHLHGAARTKPSAGGAGGAAPTHTSLSVENRSSISEY